MTVFRGGREVPCDYSNHDFTYIVNFLLLLSYTHHLLLITSLSSLRQAVPRSNLIAQLRASRIAFGEVNDAAGLSRHPALRTITVDTEGGNVESVAPGARFNGLERQTRAVPALGQQSAAIRQEFM